MHSAALAAALVSTALVPGLAQPASAAPSDVTAVRGFAYGYRLDVSLLRGDNQVRGYGQQPCVTTGTPPGCAPDPQRSYSPSVELPPEGGSRSETDPDAVGSAGPATLFSSTRATVTCEGATVPDGSVTCSTSTDGVNPTGESTQQGGQVLTAANLTSSCSASSSGLSATTTITDGMVEVESGWEVNWDWDYADPGEHPPVFVPVPTNPAPNTEISGILHVMNGGHEEFERWKYVFNEQVLNADGSLTVYAAHHYLYGPAAVGDLFIGRSDCRLTKESNTTPVAGDDAYTIDEDTPLTLPAPGVLGNDTDADGDALSAWTPSDPANGSVALNADGSFTYTPDHNFFGTDTFTYTAADPFGGTDPATVTINVTGVDDPPAPPVAVDDVAETIERKPLVVPAPGVLANDTDADGDPLTARSASDPPNGAVVLNADGSYTYTPDAEFFGTDTFTYVVDDGTGRSDTGHVTISVEQEAVTLVKDIMPGTSASNPLYARAANGTVFFASIITPIVTTGRPYVGLWKTDGTTEGTVLLKDFGRIDPAFSVSAFPQSFTEFKGAVFFTSSLNRDGDVELWKTDGTPEGTVLVKDILPGINGSTPTSLTVVGDSLFFAARGSLPPAGTSASDRELWKTDGSAEGTVMVRDIRVGPEGSAPSDFASIGNTLYFSAYNGSTNELWKSDGTALGTTLVRVLNRPGSVFELKTIDNVVFFRGSTSNEGAELWKSDGTAEGTVMAKDLNPGTASGSPSGLSVFGNTLLFSANDGTGSKLWRSDGTPAGTVMVKNVTVNTTVAMARFPTAVVGDTMLFQANDGTNGSELWRTDGTEAGTAMVADINPGLAASSPGGFSVVGDVVYFSATTADAGRELWKTNGFSAISVADIRPGAASSNPPGAASSNPSALAAVGDTMVFNADDGVHGAELWRLAAPKHPPWAVDDAYSTNEDTTLTVAAPGVLANDTDPDGDAVSARSPSVPAHGSVSLAADGSFTYTPDADFAGTDSFTYVAGDGRGGADVATVTVTVNPLNDAPVATGDAYTTAAGSPLTVAAPGVLANDTDIDGASLAAGSATDPPNGSVVLNGDGSFTYTPDAGFSGTDTFAYTASDGQGGTDTATVTITVVNLAPVAGDDAYTTPAGAALSVNAPGVLANDTDADGHAVTAGSASDPANGSVTLNGDGSFTYTPDAGFSGSDTFTYTATDPYGASDAATVTITVTPPPPSGDTRPTQLSVGDLAVLEGDGATTATFTVTRSGITTGPSTVKYKTSGGTATAGSDYTAVTTLASIAFAPGETTKTVIVAVTGDTLPEANETFNLVLSAPTGAVVADASGTATIRNDDGAAFLAVNNVTVNEGDAATFTVTRSGNTTGPSSVKYKTNAGTAVADDFTTIPLTSVDFAPGQTTKTVTVDVTGDTVDEKNEAFTLALSAPVGATIADAAATATIVDDEGPVTPGPATFVSIDDPRVDEGSSGTASATFTVTRSGDTNVASTVKYKTSGGTATAGADYAAITTLGTLSFAAGEISKTVSVEVAGDGLPEGDETFNLVLSAPTGAVIADASGTTTIVNDDGAAYLAVDNVAVTEGNSGTTTATFTITRTGNTTGASSVKVKTSGGTATAGSDYTAVGLTTVDFAAGETTRTVTVDILTDTVKEPNETFNLVLSTPVGASLSDASGTATIVNDD